MHTTQLELEIVTPMFLHGHDPNLLELRPPPFLKPYFVIGGEHHNR